MKIRKGIKDVWWRPYMVNGAVFSKNDIPFCPTTATGIPCNIITYKEAKELYRKELRQGNKQFYNDAWLCNESGEIIDNCNPPEWENDQELTDTLMAISDLYDSFFVDTKRRFLYKGCINHKTITRLQALITKAEKMLICKNKNKYEIVNKMKLNI